jgi:hypothetical protein
MALADAKIELQAFTASNLDGPLLIFFPGMDGTNLSLKNQLDNLKSVFNLRCLSVPPEDRTPWPLLVRDVLTLIDAEQTRNGPSISVVNLLAPAWLCKWPYRPRVTLTA